MKLINPTLQQLDDGLAFEKWMENEIINKNIIDRYNQPWHAALKYERKEIWKLLEDIKWAEPGEHASIALDRLRDRCVSK